MTKTAKIVGGVVGGVVVLGLGALGISYWRKKSDGSSTTTVPTQAVPGQGLTPADIANQTMYSGGELVMKGARVAGPVAQFGR